MNKNFIIILLLFNKLFSNDENKEENSPYLVDEVRTSINDLLDYEKIADIIDDENEKHQFYRSVASAIAKEKNYLDNRFDEINNKYNKYIRKFEEELGESPYLFSGVKPSFSYEYKPLSWSEKARLKNVYQKQSRVLKKQYVVMYEYYRNRLKDYKDYLYHLRDLRPEYTEEIEEFIIVNESIVEDMSPKVDFEYYKDMNGLLKGLQLFKDQIDSEHSMRVARNDNGQVSSIFWGSESDTTILKREYMYYENGLLEYYSDSVNGQPKFEVWFGENSISTNFLNYIFKPGFIPHYYDHLMKIFYTNEGLIESYQFESMSGYDIGNILLDYDENGHLIKESWYLGNSDNKVREFESHFDPTSGKYEVIEKDKFGNIVNQETISSKTGNTEE